MNDQPSMIEQHSAWQTQTPIEMAALKRENDAFRVLYSELLTLHTELISAMYEHDSEKIKSSYRKSLMSAGLLNRDAIDNILKKNDFYSTIHKTITC